MKIITKRAQITDIKLLESLKNFKTHYFKKKILRHKMWGIKSKNYNLGTYETNKISLSCFDDKRYILKDGINILAYGHKDILKWIRLAYLIMNTKNNIFFSNIRNHYLMDDEQYLENLWTIIEKSMIKKGNEFEQTVMKNDKFNDPYELTNLIIHRHFLIKTFEEINQ